MFVFYLASLIYKVIIFKPDHLQYNGHMENANLKRWRMLIIVKGIDS